MCRTNSIRKAAATVLALTLFATMILFPAHAVYAATDEYEPNDSIYAANSINVGDIVYGQTSDEDREDYFKFTAPLSGTAQIDIWVDWVALPKWEGVKIQVRDDGNRLLADGGDNMSTTSGGVITFPVTYGRTYYLRCFGNDYNLYTPCEYHFHLGYNIGRTSITSVKGRKKSFTVKWNKKAKADFYQVQYVKKSVFDDYGWSKAKTVNASAKTKSKTVKKLARKKKYYVRIRVARKISGITYYSSWSPKKTVKTK